MPLLGGAGGAVVGTPMVLAIGDRVGKGRRRQGADAGEAVFGRVSGGAGLALGGAGAGRRPQGIQPICDRLLQGGHWGASKVSASEGGWGARGPLSLLSGKLGGVVT